MPPFTSLIPRALRSLGCPRNLSWGGPQMPPDGSTVLCDGTKSGGESSLAPAPASSSRPRAGEGNAGLDSGAVPVPVRCGPPAQLCLGGKYWGPLGATAPFRNRSHLQAPWSFYKSTAVATLAPTWGEYCLLWVEVRISME